MFLMNSSSPQCGEIYVGKARVLPQLPVCVVSHPSVILRPPEIVRKFVTTIKTIPFEKVTKHSDLKCIGINPFHT